MSTENIHWWYKFTPIGYRPASREAHSTVATASNQSMYIFGGYEAGMRVNSTLLLDVKRSNWSVVKCNGEIPKARSKHVACMIGNYMIIHGGESVVKGTTIEPTTSQPHFIFDPSMHGICPGDSIGKRLKKKEKKIVQFCHNPEISVASDLSRIPTESIRRSKLDASLVLNSTSMCTDDMFALDVNTHEWFQLNTMYTPLPRSGHSANQITSNGVTYFIIFGGYSDTVALLANSLHACEVNSMFEYLQYKAQLKRSEMDQTHRRTSTLKPVSLVWKTLECRGTPPSPRHRHSSTVVSHEPNPAAASLFSSFPSSTLSMSINKLVVIGGIGFDTTTALSDIHVLDLDTLTWTSPLLTAIPPSVQRNGFSLMQGLYGHIAFSLISTVEVPMASRPIQEDWVKEVKPPPLITANRKFKNIRLLRSKSADNHTILSWKPSNDRKVTGPSPSADQEGQLQMEKKMKYEVIIFGGMNDASFAASASYGHPNIYGIDLITNQWRWIQTGSTSPEARNNHSGAILPGWTPYLTPTSTQKGETADRSLGGGGCAIIFGGVNSSHDGVLDSAWALDLTPRSVTSNEKDFLPVHRTNGSILNNSRSGPISITRAVSRSISYEMGGGSEEDMDLGYTTWKVPSSYVTNLRQTIGKNKTLEVKVLKPMMHREEEGEDRFLDQVVHLFRSGTTDRDMSQGLEQSPQMGGGHGSMQKMVRFSNDNVVFELGNYPGTQSTPFKDGG